MKKIFNEWEPTILLFLVGLITINLLQGVDIPILNVLIMLSIIYITIDIVFQNNESVKKYYVDSCMLTIFLIGSMIFGVIVCSDSVEFFAIMSISVFCSLVCYIIHSIISRTNLLIKTNREFEFLSKTYLYIKLLENNISSVEIVEKVKSKFQSLVYEYYYKNNENEDLNVIVEIIENNLLNSDSEKLNFSTSLIKENAKEMISNLYNSKKYNEKLNKLCKCNFDINII